MTNSTPSGLPGASGTGMTTGNSGTTGVTSPAGSPQPDLKDDAGSLAREAGEAGHQVADVATGETRAVASETRRQARRLAHEARRELRSQAATQQARVAGGLHAVGSEFSSMADRSAEPGMATDLVREAGQRVDRVASWLDQRDPGSLLLEVKSFARRRPGVFLAIAVGAGVVVGRLTRALATSDDDQDAVASGTRARAAGTRPTGVMPDLTPSEATGLGTPVGAGASGAARTTDTAGVTGAAGATDWTDPTAGSEPDRFTETPSVEDAESMRGRSGW